MRKVKKQKIIVVVAALIKKGDKVLMTLRDEKRNPKAHSMWELPGGKIDFGELPEEALVREIQEETGYRIKVLDTNPVLHTHIWEYPDFLQHTLLLGFRCKAVGKPRPMKDRRIKEVAWKKIADIDYSRALPSTKKFIAYLMQ